MKNRPKHVHHCLIGRCRSKGRDDTCPLACGGGASSRGGKTSLLHADQETGSGSSVKVTTSPQFADELYPMLHRACRVPSSEQGCKVTAVDTTGTTVTPSSPTESLRQTTLTLSSDPTPSPYAYSRPNLPVACLLETAGVQPAYVRVKYQQQQKLGDGGRRRVEGDEVVSPCSFASFLSPEMRARRALETGSGMGGGERGDSAYVTAAATHCTCLNKHNDVTSSAADVIVDQGGGGRCCFLIGSADHVTMVPCRNNPDVLPDLSTTTIL